jgi:hypothetical protein
MEMDLCQPLLSVGFAGTVHIESMLESLLESLLERLLKRALKRALQGD